MPQLSQASQRLFLAAMISFFFSALTAPGLAQWNSGTYKPPSEIGTPERTRPAGTRSTYWCPVPETPPSMVAIVPLNAFGVTIKSHPDFLFYLPAMTEGITPPVEFAIEDLSGNNIYKARFNPEGLGGIANISLPENSGFSGLELNKNYYWSVKIICQERVTLQEVVLLTDGFIQRVAVPPELDPSILQNLSLIEQAELLSRTGIWYDAVALLAELQRNQQRNQPLSQWTNILQAVELFDLVNQPVLDNRNFSIRNSAPF